MALWNRKYKVTVDTIQTEDLDLQFNIVKTTKKEPNTCTLRIYNLNESHREQLSQLKEPMVEIEAGYEDDIGLIFKGNVRDVYSVQEGPDWITELSSGDGANAISRSRVNLSFSRGTSLSTAIKKLAEAMNVNIGNAALKALQGNFTGASNEFLNGAVFSGRASTEMDGLLKSAGLEWSIQDDELQITKRGEALEGMSVKLTSDTGLIGSPTIGQKGIMHMTSLMNWTIVPARNLYVEAKTVPHGFYRAERCEYVGDTSGQDWYVGIEAKKL